ncbi:DUF3772 domain-containing protein [Sedimentimonas flavescens]|uniref:DUF3772 domain-containing protein n=1 Tax=Sedimentimonas flavescens TaxID=2851012 RepID=UPI0021A61010|nr:DUF3772 domain-containing protein [Sedimentimonas flavescens]MCT2538937.1 DUF3772 domain-containing protein [Sedimentimonas flavescens]
MILRFLRIWLVAMFVALPLAAQDVKLPDYKTWDKAAEEAQHIVAEGTANDQRLTALRVAMVDWRKQFLAAQGANASEIKTVREQIAALGPVPADGETEDTAIAERRAELHDTLTKLQAPGLAAVEAATHADGIIREIDDELRARATDKLLRLSPSPLNPVNWGFGLKIVAALSAQLYDEAAETFAAKGSFGTFSESAPLIALLVLVASVLLARGRRWMNDLSAWLLGKASIRARYVIEEMASVGHILVPMVGFSLLLVAASQTGLAGRLWDELLGVIGSIVLMGLFAAWLARRVFPSRAKYEAPLHFAPERRPEVRRIVLSLGLVLAIWAPLGDWVVAKAENAMRTAQGDSDSVNLLAAHIDAGLAVLAFPLLLLGGALLFRLGQLLRVHVKNEAAGSPESSFRTSVMGAVGSLLLAVGVVGPLLGGIGYVNAANAIVWPMVETLLLIGLILVLQKFLAELYVLLTDSGNEGRDSLVPVLMGFMLVLLSMPILALFWGARVEDLVELWVTFRNGINLGGVRISPSVFITFAIIFSIGYAATRILQRALRTSILPKTSIDKGGQNAIVSGLGYVGIFLAGMAAVATAGIDLSSLAIVAGALSVGIGFGLQNIVSNFVSGIILLIERPVSEGDWIEVGGQQGVVKAISVRSTIIETFDRTDVIVPNADLVSGQVTNWTRGNKTGRLIVPVGVAYGADTRRVSEILLEIAQAQPLVMMSPEPFVIFSGFGADSLNFEIRTILSDVNFKIRVLSEINHQIAERFAAEGIEIPFAQRDIWLRNPEALLGRADAEAANAAKPKAPLEPVSPAAPEPLEGIQDTAALSDNDGADDGGDGGGGDGAGR